MGYTKDIRPITAAARAAYGKRAEVPIKVCSAKINPNTHTIIEIRTNGVVIEEDNGDHVLYCFKNTDMHWRRWDIGLKIKLDKPVTV